MGIGRTLFCPLTRATRVVCSTTAPSTHHHLPRINPRTYRLGWDEASQDLVSALAGRFDAVFLGRSRPSVNGEWSSTAVVAASQRQRQYQARVIYFFCGHVQEAGSGSRLKQEPFSTVQSQSIHGGKRRGSGRRLYSKSARENWTGLG